MILAFIYTTIQNILFLFCYWLWAFYNDTMLGMILFGVSFVILNIILFINTGATIVMLRNADIFKRVLEAKDKNKTVVLDFSGLYREALEAAAKEEEKEESEKVETK